MSTVNQRVWGREREREEREREERERRGKRSRIHSVSDLEGISLKRKVLVMPSGMDLMGVSERESYKLAVSVLRCVLEVLTHPTISKYMGLRITTKSFKR
jgi:hypothetical protein